MATVVHGNCNSPRQQHHQCELTGTGASGCLTGSQHQHPHQSNISVYPTISKYLRPHTSSQLHTHQPSHIYDGKSMNTSSAQLQYGATLNQMAYMPMGTTMVSHPTSHLSSTQSTLQHSYGSSSQFPCAATPVPTQTETYRNYWSHIHAATLTYGTVNGRGNNRRKTAVQLLAETKPFYLKTDTNTIDRVPVAAEPPSSPGYRKSFLHSANLKRGRNSAPACGREPTKYNTSYNGHLLTTHGAGELERRLLPRPPAGRDVSKMHNTHTHSYTHNHTHHHHHNHHTQQFNRHSAPSYNNNMLQTKLKLLLTPENSHDRMPISTHGQELQRKLDFSTSIDNENCSGETSLPYMRKDEIVAIPPPMFLSTQSYDDSYSYAGAESSSIDDPLVLTEDYRPISPPAEYAAETPHPNIDARGRYNYQRSYSHSHEMTGDNSKYDADAFNVNSHKSLPDLHAQISRHSPHSEILSCCSRGNRSNKSTGESSLNRDSGGSSGHYTHRSEPCYRQRETERESYDSGKQICCNHTGNAAPIEVRRDSGSSTQHSANSYCGYGCSTVYGRTAAECVACRCSRNAPTYDPYADDAYLLNFPTPVVPEAFQDDYTPPSPSGLQTQLQPQSRLKMSDQRYYKTLTVDMRQQQQQQQQQHYSQSKSQPLAQAHSTIRLPPSNLCNVQSPGSTPSMEDISPPPIEFKRQKCIRLKNRNRLPVPNISPMCSNHPAPNGGSSSSNAPGQAFLFPKCISTSTEDYNRIKSFGSNSRRSSGERSMMMLPAAGCPPNEMEQPYLNYTREIDKISDLENFFDRMGLNDEKFNEIYTASRRRRSTTTDSDDSSTVFFSDVSTVDSMRLPDSTETQPQTTQPYRPTEPPSIVERNARIIKWLCNIRKLEQN